MLFYAKSMITPRLVTSEMPRSIEKWHQGSHRLTFTDAIAITEACEAWLADAAVVPNHIDTDGRGAADLFVI